MHACWRRTRKEILDRRNAMPFIPGKGFIVSLDLDGEVSVYSEHG